MGFVPQKTVMQPTMLGASSHEETSARLSPSTMLKYCTSSGNDSLFCREKAVTAAQGQTIALTDDRTRNNLEFETEVLHHSTDDGYLLIVLLAKVGTIRLDIHEEFAHDLAHAIEMSWTHRPLHHAVCGRITELSGVRFRIDFLHSRSKGDVSLASLEQTAIRL